MDFTSFLEEMASRGWTADCIEVAFGWGSGRLWWSLRVAARCGCGTLIDGGRREAIGQREMIDDLADHEERCLGGGEHEREA